MLHKTIKLQAFQLALFTKYEFLNSVSGPDLRFMH